MASPTTEVQDNTLGLEFSEPPSTALTDPREAEKSKSAEPAADSKESPPNQSPEQKKRTKPYVNPNRVSTGGTRATKLSPEELAEKMARMKLQNEKIKRSHELAQADEAAFNDVVASEKAAEQAAEAAARAKRDKLRKTQAAIDRSRDEVAKKKMERKETREWDAEKSDGRWQAPAGSKKGDFWPKKEDSGEQPESPRQEVPSPTRGRGRGGRGGDRGMRGGDRGGRGRGRGGRGGPRSEPTPAGPSNNLTWGDSSETWADKSPAQANNAETLAPADVPRAI